MATASSATARRTSQAPVVTPVVDPGAPVSSGRHSGAVSGAAVAPGAGAARCESGSNSVSVSASVGHDHCGVFSNVFGDRSALPSVVDDRQHEAAHGAAAGGEGDAVSRLVEERKRRFHSGRLLELKNLPDGCTEQVGNWDQVNSENIVLANIWGPNALNMCSQSSWRSSTHTVDG